MKVLYVDDEEINLFLFKASFKNNFDVITAQSAKEALEILESDRGIEKVITDMKMPVMDGLSFVNEAIKNYPELPYYLLTGFDKTPDIEEAIEKKIIRHYFRKPLDKEEILENILS